MSTVPRQGSGPREMSFRGFVDKTLQRSRCCRTEAWHGNCILFSSTQGTKAVGAKAKYQEQHWLHVKPLPGGLQ